MTADNTGSVKSPLAEGDAIEGRYDAAEYHARSEALMARLTAMYEQARADGRGTDALDLVLARDAVEVLNALLIAVNGHRFDTQHLHDKGVYPKIRLADQMLYEAAGMERIEDA